MRTELKGQIERITYANEESGYTIARAKVAGHKELVTIVGNLPAPTPGEVLLMHGEWIRHPKFGEQFKIAHYETELPATAYGIQKYLGSGLIKGIGPVMARRIVKRFGPDTLDIIETAAERLTEVTGIGRKRVDMIRKAWADQKEIRDVMLFLQSHGVGTGYATKIFKQYGKQSIRIVRQNPYRLAMEIDGIGFVIADNIARQLGFDKHAPLRLEAGVIFVLHQLSDDGHVYYPDDRLVAHCREILDVDPGDIAAALDSLARERRVVIEALDGASLDADVTRAVYLEHFYFCETSISRRLKLLITSPKGIRPIDTAKALAWVQQQLAIQLAPKQSEAVAAVLRHKVMVITGGPGTGKTTIINAILKIFAKVTPRILLAAPTGRAAKRMSEATGYEAKTIHRLLEYSVTAGGFQCDENNPLTGDLLIIDEASMIDTVLMHHLLKAVPLHATLVLVGDVNQLPSVGAGTVLEDVIAANIVPVVTLNEIFRQAKTSRIVISAHQINQGRLPPPGPPDDETDFYMIQQEAPEKVLATILELIQTRIPNRFGFDPVRDIQVLTPMHRGILGATNLNTELQRHLNPGDDAIVRGGRLFRARDKVMQIKNNYDKDVFNGDIGLIKHIRPENQELVVDFDGRTVSYDHSDLDEIVLAYAVSVHKSQGSEYPVVIMPIVTQHYVLLQRNLVYTAVTRGKRLVVMVGTRKALAIAVANNTPRKRFSHLRHRLSED